MSQENVELVLQNYRAFEAKDFEAISRTWHPNGRTTAPEGWPEPGPFEGRDAIVRQFRRLASDMGEQHIREVEIVAARDDWVVAAFLWEVRGAGSGAAVATKLAGAYRVRDGTLVEAHFRWTPEEALEAAGLSE
jgi:ketosteroid isomerase-like protein